MVIPPGINYLNGFEMVTALRINMYYMVSEMDMSSTIIFIDGTSDGRPYHVISFELVSSSVMQL